LDIKKAVEHGAEELARIRAEDHYEFVDVHYFFAGQHGGDWTAEHIGVAANCSFCKPRKGLATLWCERFQYPKGHTFAFHLYRGRRNANELAREWVRRSEFFFMQYFNAEDKAGFRYTQAHKDAWTDSPEFQAWMLSFRSVEHPAFRRGHELRLEYPRQPIDDL